MMPGTMRADLPDPPARIAALPVDERGYPVPWFVGWLDERGEEVARGQGVPDHRVIRGGGIQQALRAETCWICGVRLGALKTFPVGPMCVVNRTTSEPPSHRECAQWATRACPFLSRPHARRRETGLPDDAQDAAGTMLRHNPGVTALWTTRSYLLHLAPGGILIQMGDPLAVEWVREGRPANRAEVVAGLDVGVGALRDAAAAEGASAYRRLERDIETARVTFPPA